MKQFLFPQVSIGHAIWRTGLTPDFYLGMLGVIKTYRGIIEMIVIGDISVAWARNGIVKQFLEGKSEYLFFVDSDVWVPTDSLTKLVQHSKDICSGLYFKRKAPFYPLLMDRELGTNFYKQRIQYPEDLIEVDACGAGCLLVKRGVLEKLKEPWFLEPDGKTSDDIYFCEIAKKAGYKIFVEARIKCRHVTEMIVTEETFKKAYFIDGIR